MPEYAFNFLVSKFKDEVLGQDILLLGVSYRGDVGDTRNTPVDLFHECLINKGCKVFLHDPYVAFWQEKSLKVNKNLEEVLSQSYDVVVISTGHSVYKTDKFLEQLIKNKPKIVFDTIGIFSEKDIKSLKKVTRICILGRGDLN